MDPRDFFAHFHPSSTMATAYLAFIGVLVTVFVNSRNNRGNRALEQRRLDANNKENEEMRALDLMKFRLEIKASMESDLRQHRIETYAKLVASAFEILNNPKLSANELEARISDLNPEFNRAGLIGGDYVRLAAQDLHKKMIEYQTAIGNREIVAAHQLRDRDDEREALNDYQSARADYIQSLEGLRLVSAEEIGVSAMPFNGISETE